MHIMNIKLKPNPVSDSVNSDSFLEEYIHMKQYM